MANQKNTRSYPAKTFFIGLGILALSLTGCQNPTSPDEETQPYITVRNSSGIALDIYMDGTFRFSLENDTYDYIENVTPGTHLLEAKKKDTDSLVKSMTAEISEDFSYTWTITSNATLKITNNYGETLDIYGDGQFKSEIADQAEITLNIPYGEHLLEAKERGGSTVVASTTIEIDEDIIYPWVIRK